MRINVKGLTLAAGMTLAAIFASGSGARAQPQDFASNLFLKLCHDKKLNDRDHTIACMRASLEYLDKTGAGRAFKDQLGVIEATLHGYEANAYDQTTFLSVVRAQTQTMNTDGKLAKRFGITHADEILIATIDAFAKDRLSVKPTGARFPQLSREMLIYD